MKKQYKLLQWYPTLSPNIMVGAVANFNTKNNRYETLCSNCIIHTISLREITSSNFWKLIEEKTPLLTTQDGVEIFDENTELTIVYDDFLKENISMRALLISDDLSLIKVFHNQKTAGEYIWRNKRNFSYEDIMKSGVVTFADDKKHFMELAKERG